WRQLPIRLQFNTIQLPVFPGCGGHLYMESGAFNSPNYPDVYPPNVECVWTITSSPGNRLQLSFIMFQLQQSSDCSNDYLEVREGHSTGTLDGRFCGDSLPSNYTSIMGHILWIQFVSDSSVSGAGFRAITGSSGQITSPLYPRTYPNNADYHWTVTVDSDSHIQIQFLDIDIEDLFNCYYDNTNAFLLGEFCGLTLPNPVRSSGSTITLEFKSDTVIGGKACGGFIELNDGDPLGYITSPNYPSNYPQNIDCVWIITVPNGETVQLDFEGDFYIEAHTGCMYDYIEVCDGPTSDATLMGRLCGNTRPSTQHSSGTTMYIRFRTDGSITHIVVSLEAPFIQTQIIQTTLTVNGTWKVPLDTT
uniref:CUB domain-containing protein n=1 Tax=Sinocyclocheilus anshuiensis TaxID=1608454 RepID=A0A671NLK5_9TELE